MAITVTATVEATTTPPRVRLDVSASAGETSTTLTRLNPDGSTVPVRTYDGNPLPISSGTALLYDYEAPYGAAVSFSSQETPGNVSAQVTVPASQVWLIHPGVPGLSLPVRLAPGSFTQRVANVAQGVFYPMGRTNPVVQTDGARKGRSSQVVLNVFSYSEQQAVDELLADAGVLLLNVSATLNYNFPTSYIAVGNVTAASWIDKVYEPGATITLPFTVVDRPAGGSQAERTFADLLDFPTLASLMTAYKTFGDLLAGP